MPDVNPQPLVQVEGHDGILVIRASDNVRAWNGIQYKAGKVACGTNLEAGCGVPREVFNVSATEPVVAVVARSDASEWETIVPYDKRAR